VTAPALTEVGEDESGPLGLEGEMGRRENKTKEIRGLEPMALNQRIMKINRNRVLEIQNKI
jgi:hypothetical protein